jgi:hypothetical protein
VRGSGSGKKLDIGTRIKLLLYFCSLVNICYNHNVVVDNGTNTIKAGFLDKRGAASCTSTFWSSKYNWVFIKGAVSPNITYKTNK